MSDRVVWIDNARGIGIILVVVGHAPVGRSVHEVIFAFHMPLFFVLSGLLANRSLDRPLSHHAGRLARTLLVPFATFGAVALVFDLAMLRVTRGSLPTYQDAFQDAARIAYGVAEVIPVDNPLWFFPCLFLAAFGSIALVRVFGREAAFALTTAATLVLMAYGRPPVRPPWSADSAVVAAWFFQAGMVLGTSLSVRDLDRAASRPVAGALAAIAFSVTALIAAANGPTDLNQVVFGNPALYLPGAGFGVAGVLLLAAALPPFRALRRLSDDSRVIFPLHILVFSTLQGVAELLLGMERGWLWNNGLAAALLFVAAGLAVPIPIAWMLRRIAPWAIGEHPARAVPNDAAAGDVRSGQRS